MKSNIDNQPVPFTNKDGEKKFYSFSSKNWERVDPSIDDDQNFHTCPANMVYCLMRNRYSKEWEFPSAPMFVGDTFMEGRSQLFSAMTDDWKVTHIGRSPQMHTLRGITDKEKEMPNNEHINAVRTFYFLAFHARGPPGFNFDKIEWDKMAWVPKARMNQYLTPERFDAFIDSLEIR